MTTTLYLLLYLLSTYFFFSDELLLQEDGSDGSGIATEFSKGMQLGQSFGSTEPLVGVGRFSHASSSTSSNMPRPIQPFSHAEMGSPPTHDPHVGYGRPGSKPSHFVPHISQNSPSRLGQQQPVQRLNHGRSSAAGRGSDWSQTKHIPSNFNSGGPRSPGSSSFSNGGSSWGNAFATFSFFRFFSFYSQHRLFDYRIN